MSINLIQLAQSALSDGVMQQLSAHFGLTPDATQRVVSATAPTLVAALMNKSTSPEGAHALFTSILTPEVSAHIADELPRLAATAPGVTQLASTGRRLLEQAIDRRVDGLSETVAGQSGTPLHSSYALTGILGAVLLGVLKQHLLASHSSVGQLPTLLSHQLPLIGGQLKDAPMLALGLGTASPFIGHVMQQLIAVSSYLRPTVHGAVSVAPPAVASAAPSGASATAPAADAAPFKAFEAVREPAHTGPDEHDERHPCAWLWWLIAALALIAAVLAFMPARDRASLLGGGRSSQDAAASAASAAVASPASAPSISNATSLSDAMMLDASSASSSSAAVSSASRAAASDAAASSSAAAVSSVRAAKPAAAPAQSASAAPDASSATAAPASAVQADPLSGSSPDNPPHSFRQAIAALLAPGASCTSASVAHAMNLQVIRFPSQGSQVPATALATLSEAARVLKACAKNGTPAKIEVAGYSDNVGMDDVGRDLSKQRADAIRAALIKAGAPASSLVARGYGPIRPIASNATEAGRSQNRRVEFVAEPR